VRGPLVEEELMLLPRERREAVLPAHELEAEGPVEVDGEVRRRTKTSTTSCAVAGT
jgi:hypothetical protein